MKKLLISFSLVTILGTAYSQKTPPPFTYNAQELEANRIYVLMNQIKLLVPKSKVPSDEGELMKSNADSVIMDIQKQYNAWIAANKKDSASGKK